MKKILIIVESPTKVKTLKRILGSRYLVESSVGHIRDLPKQGFGIDVEHGFEPIYENLKDKKGVIENLRKAAKKCDLVYLSPDPDREGEAIAWHIAHILPKGLPVQRVTFHAITKPEVVNALNHPGEINLALVNAQQARRLLDRIVGYKISPILQRRITRKGQISLSAGRVQSIALKLVVDREREIELFNPIEYWTIQATFEKEEDAHAFQAVLFSVDGKKIEKEAVEGKEVQTISNEMKASRLVAILKHSQFTVGNVEKKEKKRNPVPPFTTSTLQQEASRHYGFSATRTMSIAQGLYEGVDLGKQGTEGLITYMRTDSVRNAPEALQQARQWVDQVYGQHYLPKSVNLYKNKKHAQDAHEAIRPTNFQHPPEKIQSLLSSDQYRLYLLIWRRFIASQMAPAIYDTVSCDIITDHQMKLRASGSVMKFKGFLAIYEEEEDRVEGKEGESKEKRLPDLEEGQALLLRHLSMHQSWTKPPPRYTEASLIKALEMSGIGRPSTYAATMNKIHSRTYTTKERLMLKPTELGKVIAQMLEVHFNLIMDVGFTSKMEEELDDIAENHKDWKGFIQTFWETFLPIVEKAEEEAFVPKITTQISCPKCGNKLQKIWARGKYFYGCSFYPDCKFTVSIEALEFKKEDYVEQFDWDQACPKCSAHMALRFGRFGAFLGCSRYPECNGIVNIPKKDDPPPDQSTSCPAIGCGGVLVRRMNRWGRPFFSCSHYPECDVLVNRLDEAASKYVNHPKTPYQKKEIRKGKEVGKKGKKSKRKTPVSKKQPLHSCSPELVAVIGKEKRSRGEITKKIWEYIKEQGCKMHKIGEPSFQIKNWLNFLVMINLFTCLS